MRGTRCRWKEGKGCVGGWVGVKVTTADSIGILMGTWFWRSIERAIARCQDDTAALSLIGQQSRSKPIYCVGDGVYWVHITWWVLAGLVLRPPLLRGQMVSAFGCEDRTGHAPTFV